MTTSLLVCRGHLLLLACHASNTVIKGQYHHRSTDLSLCLDKLWQIKDRWRWMFQWIILSRRSTHLRTIPKSKERGAEFKTRHVNKQQINQNSLFLDEFFRCFLNEYKWIKKKELWRRSANSCDIRGINHFHAWCYRKTVKVVQMSSSSYKQQQQKKNVVSVCVSQPYIWLRKWLKHSICFIYYEIISDQLLLYCLTDGKTTNNHNQRQFHL